MIKYCKACPRKCMTQRSAKQGFGFCSCPDKIYLAHYGLHFFEEPVISGKNGSGTIFFSGCNLKCSYCQNYEISRQVCGKPFSVNQFISVMKELESKGAENINLVTPTPYSSLIIKALKKYKPSVPVVYNTSGYENPEVIKKLLPYIDIFLTDFKYSSDTYSYLSQAKDYSKYALESLKIMLTKPDTFDENEMMKTGVIVRHLVLPGMLENTFEVLKILSDNHARYVSIMAQFTPTKYSGELNRKITKKEYNKVLNELFKYDFEGFVQDLDSSGMQYVPTFSLLQK